MIKSYDILGGALNVVAELERDTIMEGDRGSGFHAEPSLNVSILHIYSCKEEITRWINDDGIEAIEAEIREKEEE